MNWKFEMICDGMQWKTHELNFEWWCSAAAAGGAGTATDDDDDTIYENWINGY